MNSKFKSLITVLALMSVVLSATAYSQVNAQAAPQVREITLIGVRFGYNSTAGGPDIVANQGDTVRLTLISNDTVSHDWVLDADSPSPYNVRTAKIKNMNSSTVEFVASFSGTFKYYCSIGAPGMPTHRQRGMEGNFIVNPLPSGDLSTQVQNLDNQLQSLTSSVNEQMAQQKAALEALSTQITILLALSGVAVILSVVAIVLSLSAKKRSAQTS